MITERTIRNAKKYCRDDYRKIPGYERALKEPRKFLVHHVLGLTINGEHAHDHKELKRLGMYYDRPFFELQWMSFKEHTQLHTKANPPDISGEKNGMYGKTCDMNPNWKGNDVGPMGSYKRANKLYKAGKITEEEFQKARNRLQNFRRDNGLLRRKQTSSQS